MNKIVTKAQEVKKALTAAAGVLVTMQAASGTFIPETAKGWLGTAISVLAVFGITWKASNLPQ